MKIHAHILIPIVGSIGMVAAIAWGITEIVTQEDNRPPPMTDEQVAAEVKRCNALGLVFHLYQNRRSGLCLPPKTIQVRQ